MDTLEFCIVPEIELGKVTGLKVHSSSFFLLFSSLRCCCLISLARLLRMRRSVWVMTPSAGML